MTRSIQTLHRIREQQTRTRSRLRDTLRRREKRIDEIRDLLGQVVFSPLTPVSVRIRLQKLAKR